MAEQREKKQKKGKVLWLVILVLLILLGAAAGMYIRLMKDQEKSRLSRDELALGGLLPGKTSQEIEELLNAKIEEGMVNIGIAAEPVFEENGKRGRLGIENIEANNYSFQVTLILNDTGETVYESGLIDPGFYIEFVELSKTLKAGDYPAKAKFVTYSLDESEDKIGETNINITLHVTDGKFYP